MRNELQELCKSIFGIDWVGVQSDKQDENDLVDDLRDQLCKYNKATVVMIMMAVLEARDLTLRFSNYEGYNPFKDMGKFMYIKTFPKDEEEEFALITKLRNELAIAHDRIKGLEDQLAIEVAKA